MWILTPLGFFSIVQKPADAVHGTLTVRARVKSDLIALKRWALPTLGEIETSEHTDYRYRATAGQTEVMQALARLAGDIGYDNFKDEVGRVQGYERAQLYSMVWSTLYRMKDDVPYEWDVDRLQHRASVPDADTYGGLLLNEYGHVLLRQPRNLFGGYFWTFAKGRANPGESPQQTALREVREETGYEAEIIGHLSTAYVGTTGTSAFFVMHPRNHVDDLDQETANLKWSTLDEAHGLIRQTTTEIGRRRDLRILADLQSWLARNEALIRSSSGINYKE